MSDHSKPPTVLRTGTDTVMRAMEGFSESEPVWVMVIYANEQDELHWLRSDMSTQRVVGALEMIKTQIMHDWVQGGDEE